MYLVSACLAGVNCRYDGDNYLVPKIKKMVNSGKAIPLCPEVIAGFGIPRPCCEIVIENEEKKVFNEKGEELTDKFKKGAQKVLKIAKILDVNQAILKSKSPSCGYNYIYDGTFSGKLKKDTGITAKKLADNNIEIYTENNYDWSFLYRWFNEKITTINCYELNY